jgi:hypothetical protein
MASHKGKGLATGLRQQALKNREPRLEAKLQAELHFASV